MKKLLFLLLFFAVGSIQGQGLSELLFAQIDDAKDLTAKVPVYLLLRDVVLEEASLNQLIKTNKKEKNSHNVFLQSFLVASQTQELKYINQFIEAYPEGEELMNLHASLLSSIYKTVGSPFQKALANYALSDDKALTKLIKSIEFLDASFATCWEEEIKMIYSVNPERVKNIFKEVGIDINQYHYFLETKSHNPNIGKSGKLEAKDVIYLVMQNYDVPLSVHASCEGMGTKFEDITIGEFLSGFWAYNDPATPNTDVSNDSYPYDSLQLKYYIDVTVEEGKSVDLGQKHWKATLMLGGDEDGGHVLWFLGVEFLILDEDWVVLRDSFRCLGN